MYKIPTSIYLWNMYNQKRVVDEEMGGRKIYDRFEDGVLDLRNLKRASVMYFKVITNFMISESPSSR